MKYLKRSFYLLHLLVAIFGYIFIFGESGYLRQVELRSRLEQINASIQDLKQENGILNEKYLLLKERSGFSTESGASPLQE